jgi:biuret amidohydrolase
MPDLATLLTPATTAVVTSECQNGVVGDTAIFPQLAAVAAPAVRRIEQLVAGARDAGVQVVHCLAHRREDGLGANRNARLFGAAARAPVTLAAGSEAGALVASLGPADGDLVLTRLHGLNPMAGTDLDPLLRNLGVTTVVVAGVSVNVAITNLVMDAVNAGYQVVLPRDAVAGTPVEYADQVIDNTLSLLATVTSVEGVLAAWSGSF